MEAFFGVMKNGNRYGMEDPFESFAAFKKAVAEYMKRCNGERVREACGCKPPIVFRAEWAASRSQSVSAWI